MVNPDGPGAVAISVAVVEDSAVEAVTDRGVGAGVAPAAHPAIMVHIAAPSHRV